MTDGSAYICRIPTQEEMIRRWDEEIALHRDKQNWIAWKDEAIRDFLEGRSIPCYGLLGDAVICEATAVPVPGEMIVELRAFRTRKGLSRTRVFLAADAPYAAGPEAAGIQESDRWRGAARDTEPGNLSSLGFTEPVGIGTETYPDGSRITVEYYGKHL